MTRVKICGLAQAEDVRLAVRAGAWAVGFVLTNSPRRVSPAQAAELASQTGHALTVGVVSTEPAEWIAEAMRVAGLQAVQLSAGADGPSVAEVRAAAAARGLHPSILAASDTTDAFAADFILLDARTAHAYGGTGLTLDWRRAAGLGLERDRLVLAGGLTPDNVREAIFALRPLAVDVSSGVELAPARKDPAQVRAFCAAVQRADQDLASTLCAATPHPHARPFSTGGSSDDD
jgi:phosphoribosylanthranilate isomerase